MPEEKKPAEKKDAPAAKPAAKPLGRVKEKPAEEAAKPKKEAKGKHTYTKRPPAARWKNYKVDGETLSRLKKPCPRCGPGNFLADHKNRLACGRCGYTEFKGKEKQ